MISCAVIKKESLARAIVRLVRDSVFFSCKISGSSQYNPGSLMTTRVLIISYLQDVLRLP